MLVNNDRGCPFRFFDDLYNPEYHCILFYNDIIANKETYCFTEGATGGKRHKDCPLEKHKEITFTLG